MKEGDDKYGIKSTNCSLMPPLEVLKIPRSLTLLLSRAKVQKHIFQSQLKGDFGVQVSMYDLLSFISMAS